MKHKRVLALLPLFLIIVACVPSIKHETYVPQDRTPISAPFVKIVNPAFVDDYAGKVVTFQAMYLGTMDILMDLPSKYKKGYIRIMLCGTSSTTANMGGQSVPNCQNMSYAFLVPKDASDSVFSLNNGATVSVVAQAVAGALFSGITGGGQKSLLFEVLSISAE